VLTRSDVLTGELTDTERWDAVVARDARYDGTFVLAVRSTGIYCRPSCSARKPRRDNVAFYADSDAAEAAGFRACKRCRPNALSADVEIIERACEYIHDSEGVPPLAEIGAHVGLSPFYFQRVFKRVMGVSPKQYADLCRVERFKAELRGRDTVTDALYEAGFGSSSGVYERAVAHLGMTPAIYRKGGAGMEIRYTICDSPLGRLLVAATDSGICAVYINDADAVLEETLHEEFPAASFRRVHAELFMWTQTIVAYLNGWEPHLDLPLDLRGSAFQLRVWQALREIPYGETWTYMELAEHIGQPKAARAVGQACAANPTALIVPCHRVINAGIADPVGDEVKPPKHGYRWGAERKRALLKMEREHKNVETDTTEQQVS
jgi:AraC family transcriptional regulator of adaptative response/methylated-DNA-[protein]-cysteine methyltransferase